MGESVISPPPYGSSEWQSPCVFRARFATGPAGRRSPMGADGTPPPLSPTTTAPRHPGFRGRVLDETGRIRTYVNVYIGEDDARTKGGTDAPVPEGSEVMV